MQEMWGNPTHVCAICPSRGVACQRRIKKEAVMLHINIGQLTKLLPQKLTELSQDMKVWMTKINISGQSFI